MKKHDYKRIEIVAADGFTPKELKTIQHTLEHALEEGGTKTAITLHCSSKRPGRPSPIIGDKIGDKIEMETARVEHNDDHFEEALHCVEAL